MVPKSPLFRPAMLPFAAWLACPAGLRAQAVFPPASYAALFSAEALGPNPSDSLRIGFTLHYRGAVPHAAFAMARDAGGRSVWRFVRGEASPAQAEQVALERCTQDAAQAGLAAPCRILARDGAVVDRGHMPPQDGTLGPFRWSPLHLHRGPQAARGVVIWGHGVAPGGLDSRNATTPGMVSVLNDAGWDVLRYDRHPGDDELNNALERLLAGLPAVRAAGYRRIILGGQSRGGWQSLLAAGRQPAAMEAVIAHAPARHGSWRRGISGNNLGAGLDDFRQVVAGLPASGPRILVAVFDEDDYDPDPAARAGMVEGFAQRRAVPALALWPQGITGHGGGSHWRYTRDMAGCVLRFIDADAAAAPQGMRRGSC